PKRARAPSAIARATWALTAPCAARTAASTPSRSRFASSAYDTTPPRKYPLDPGTAVRAAATMPPVQDSARATVARPASDAAWSRSASATSSSSPTLLALGLDRWGARLEQPRLGDPTPAERAERLPVQREERGAGRARTDLDRGLTGEREHLAARVCEAGPADGRVDLAVDPDLDPRRAALDRDDEVHALVGDGDVPGLGGGFVLGVGRRRRDRPAARRELERAGARVPGAIVADGHRDRRGSCRSARRAARWGARRWSAGRETLVRRGDRDLGRVQGRALHGDRAVLERGAVRWLIHGQLWRLDLAERYRQDDGLRGLGVLAGIGVRRVDLELVPAPPD